MQEHSKVEQWSAHANGTYDGSICGTAWPKTITGTLSRISMWLTGKTTENSHNNYNWIFSNFLVLNSIYILWRYIHPCANLINFFPVYLSCFIKLLTYFSCFYFITDVDFVMWSQNIHGWCNNADVLCYKWLYHKLHPVIFKLDAFCTKKQCKYCGFT